MAAWRLEPSMSVFFCFWCKAGVEQKLLLLETHSQQDQLKGIMLVSCREASSEPPCQFFDLVLV
ncbi:unnamed protein product [Penicillium roqueforti FM164]|uniref:Uncharacterized protein n=1 Tax=Penicillium roqueforti (strain FM164) TaxID=1365484 RepID=W6QKZ0_PENRF|nr:unnamed protein product [Penicillium roqueforti FM164]